jgi:hypothetical protein
MVLPSKHAAGPAESRRGTIPGRPPPAALEAAIAAACRPLAQPSGTWPPPDPDWRVS